MSSDKFIYLFGKLAPALSLVLSMSLRLVPKFKNQAQKVAEAQKCIGRDLSSGGIWQKIKTATVIFSVMITWALENAIESSDSMKSRGYGLKGRTSFSIYTVDEQDKYTLIWLLFCGLFLTAGSIVGAFEFDYFPSIAYRAFDMTTIPFYFVYFSLCITPSVLNFAKEKKWKTLYSRI
jgi:energy-coupling factor transport system permease protein